MSSATNALGPISAESIVARLERLPPSRWDLKIRAIVATATFFDGYDVVAIAFVLPALIGMWHLRPQQIGLLLSSGFAGQLIGATVFGWVAERRGRVLVLNWTIVILSIFGLGCAFATSYGMLLALRFFQGLGLGGEIPVAATFVTEIASASRRGRFVLLYQLFLPIGFMVASLSSIWIVPHLGWQWMFGLGAIPGVLTIFLRRLVPESPRWLARHGRGAEADEITTRIEDIVARETGRPLPPPVQNIPRETKQTGKFSNLFEGIYFLRTLSVWGKWFCAAIVGYGLLVWLPTIFRTVYHMSLRDSLIYGSIGNVTSLMSAICCALLVDRVGRKPLFVIAFLCGGAPLLVVWWLGKNADAVMVMILAAVAMAAVSMVQLGLWTYTPEIYPTRMRSLGTGIASAWARLASIIAPNAVAFLIVRTSISGIFFAFALIGILGAVIVVIFGVETKMRMLEEVSP